MANINITDYIRNYSRESGYRFSDLDMASIIYHQDMTMDEKQKLLRRIAKKTRDNSLKIQISERIKQDSRAISMFNENDGSSVYVLINEDDEFGYDSGFYSSFKAAFIAAVKTKKAFDIEKHQMMNEDEASGSTGPVSVISFDENGNPVQYESAEIDETEDAVKKTDDRFEYCYINLPNPFDTGDVVRDAASGRCGVVITSREKWLAGREKEDRSYEDTLLSVDFISEDGYFENFQVSPVGLEPADINGEGFAGQELLENAGRLLRGEIPVSEFITIYASEV